MEKSSVTVTIYIEKYMWRTQLGLYIRREESLINKRTTYRHMHT